MYIGVNGMRIVRDTSISSMKDFENPLSILFSKQSIYAKSRRISSTWTLESSSDIKSMCGEDLMSTMIQSLQYEMQSEIDREIFNHIMNKQRFNFVKEMVF